jgi:hypothetical protein
MIFTARKEKRNYLSSAPFVLPTVIGARAKEAVFRISFSLPTFSSVPLSRFFFFLLLLFLHCFAYGSHVRCGQAYMFGGAQ